jgi:hypothetical protein
MLRLISKPHTGAGTPQMTMTLIDTAAPAKIAAAKLRAGSWGGDDTVCMMSALVPGAQSASDCVTAGWPRWLAELNVRLFDANVGAKDETAARNDFAMAVAKAVAVPRDYDRALTLFLIRRLDGGNMSALKTLHSLKGDFAQQISAVEAVVALLHRKLGGEDVSTEMRAAARAAADAAARAAADAAADAAYAAYAAADAAARAAADAAARAAYAAYAAADAAARAAARDDLIASLNAA